MCGISGIVSRHPSLVKLSDLERMNECLSHRGPESGAVWMNPTQSAALGHRRLRIIDTSESSAQPMHYLGRYTVVHNGEIYNYIELRENLAREGYQFETSSDTEVILACYDFYKENCLTHFDGMFAFAIWDEEKNELFCARDRFGEKPFFYQYHQASGTLYFGSELKSFQNGERRINKELLLLYLTLGHTNLVTQPSATFIADIQQLPPAHYARFNITRNELVVNRYWSCSKETISSITEEEAVANIKRLFATSVTRRLRSDVSLGSSLSGGLDSSTIVTLMKELLGKSFETFSAVFPGYIKDESKYIDSVAAKLQLKSNQISPDAQSLMNDFPAFIDAHHAPVASASAYAQYKVFQLAKQQEVTVLLDGQGADEIFGGYSRYLHWYLQELLRHGKVERFKRERKALKDNEQPIEWTYKNLFAAMMPAKTKRQLEEREVSKVLHSSYLNKQFVEDNFRRELIFKPEVRSLNDILYFTAFNSGLEELLRYADRNSMAHSREVRLPFLFHELVEFIFTLPADFKIRNGFTKWILRSTMSGKLPDEITWRKKKIGFEVPQDQWMINDAVQLKVREAKTKLIDAGILSGAFLYKNNRPMRDSSADWKFLVAANLL